VKRHATVASAPQCDSLDRIIITPALPLHAAAFSLRALDAPPARETLMLLIVLSAIVPVGCTPDLALFEQ
jgi:hypothetical protein